MKIIFEREKCIGCGSCEAVCPDYFHLKEDGLSFLKDAVKNEETGNYELKLEQEVACIDEAAEACPVQIISIIKK